MPWFSVKTTRTVLETEKNNQENNQKNMKNNRKKQLKEQTARTFLAFAFLVMSFLKRQKDLDSTGDTTKM